VHQGNPNAQLVVGALALDNFDEASAPAGYPGAGKGGVFNARFLSELLQYMQANPLPNGERYFDVMSFNYYDIYGPYWQGQAEGVGITAKTNAVRKQLSDAGMQAPLMVGETGEDSSILGTEGQSENGIKILIRALASNLTHVVWWTFRDFPDSAPPPSNTWKYGLLDQDNQPKPMYAAYQTASKQLTGASYVQPLAVEGGEGFLFNRGGAGIGVVWSSSDTPVTIAFAANVLQVTDLYGGAQVVADLYRTRISELMRAVTWSIFPLTSRSSRRWARVRCVALYIGGRSSPTILRLINLFGAIPTSPLVISRRPDWCRTFL
jgi:hypothetical protein